MWVRFRVGPGELEVTVADEGVGIRPHPPAPEFELEGLGMSLIQTLTDRVELLGGAGEGTEVQMAFGFDAGPERSWTVAPSSAHSEIDPPPGDLSIAVSAGPLAAPVLGRVIAMLAARAGFSLEGISDAQLVTDSLAARLPGVSPGGEIRLAVDLPEREQLIRAGPLNERAGERLLVGSPSDGLPPVLERLTRGGQVEQDDRGETLRLDLVSPR